MLQSFSRESSLFFFLSGYSHSLGCYFTLAPSDCPQGIQAGSPPCACSPCLPAQPCSLLADASVRATSLLDVAARRVICGFFFFFFSFLVMLSSKILKFPTDPPVIGFPGLWNLLLHDSLPGSPSLTHLSFFLSFIFCPTSF